MNTRIVSLILAVAIGVNSVGCQSASTPVCEYKPGFPTSQKVVMTPGMFALYNSSTEVTEVFVDRETPVGFRRDGNQLMAVAGSYEWRLLEAQYAWRYVPTPKDTPTSGARPAGAPVGPNEIVQVALGAIAFIVVVPFVVACWCAKGWYKSSGGQ